MNSLLAVPSSLRRLNEKAAIRQLMRLGSASRADLAKAAGMSQPTAGKIVDQLVRAGVLEETPLPDAPSAPQPTHRSLQAQRRLGRPGQMFRLNRTTPRFLIIQLGVQETRLALCPVCIPDEDDWPVSFTTPGDLERWASRLRDAIKQLRRGALFGVLVSVPGVVDERTGEILFSPNLHWTEGVGLRRVLGRILEWPVEIVQEIRALALGHLAAEPREESFLLVDFGDGMGGAVVTGGQLFQGALPLNGEVGHTRLPSNNRRCGCGAIGCLETLVSRRGLLESFAAHGGSRSWTLLVRQLSQDSLPTWLKAALDAAAASIAGALNVLGLRRVILTGPLASVSGVAGYLAEAIRGGAIWARFGDVTCEAAPRRWAAGLVAVGIDRLVAGNGSAKMAVPIRS